MIQFVLACIFLSLSLTAVTLLKTYYYLPMSELKRQAAERRSLARILWRAVAFGSSLQLLLWTVLSVSGAVGLVLLTRVAPPFLGIIAVALLLIFAFLWIPRTRLTSVGAHLATWCTPTVVWLLSLLRPVLDRLAAVASRFPLTPHTGLYEKADFLQMVRQQKQQPDNRISAEVLSLLERALHFDDYRVSDIVVPRGQVKALSVNESVGPVLMDELHASGFSRFPVYEDDKNTIVGTLYLRDIVEGKHSGTVDKYADRQVYYIHEQDTLAEALRAFRRAKQQLLVVVNSFEEYVGIITISDVLQKLVNLNHAVFDQHDDRAAVARKHEKQSANKTEVAETPPEVVE